MTEPTRSTIRQRLYAFLIAGIGGLMASAASFGMSVYEAAHPPETPTIPVGQQIDTGRWFVTIRSARVGTVPPTGVKPFEPKRIVMVDMDVENRSATPSGVLYSVIKPTPEIEGQRMPAIYLDRDKYFAGSFNPNMPERITMAWEWPDEAAVPETLTLTVIGQIHKLRDNLYGMTGWYDRDPVAIVQLPLEEAP